MKKKYIYLFKEGKKEDNKLLGGKGANLCEMTRLKLPVPKGFIITTEACNDFFINNELPDNLEKEVYIYLKKLEHLTKKKINDKKKPLLLSVRSGSRVSMPGMMDTILNLGMNDMVVESFENKRFAYDSYRRLIMMFSDVVMGLDRSKFEEIINRYKNNKNTSLDIDLDEEDMISITKEFKELYKSLSKEEFPQDIKTQLIRAIKAVFKSWNNERAIYYRKINNIPDRYGTAVNIQEMVYGNLNNNSGTGVAFSRNPSTGENELYGEFLLNAQGEDVVAGVRTPEDISKLKEILPSAYDEFYKYAKYLETHYKDMQDMEFTIEDGKLYILQTRIGKRTCLSSIKIAVDMVKEGLITKEEAILRVDPKMINQLLHDTFDDESVDNNILAKGLAASPGCASGKIYFNAKDVLKAKEKGIDSILVREETSPEDIIGMKNANGIITVRGGMTSHAAVVARGMGKCCVSGVSSFVIDEKKKTLTTQNKEVFKEGDYLSIDGTNGIIYKGKINTKSFSLTKEVIEFFDYVDEYKKIGVRCNADTEEDVLVARKFGAEGIGLCRTEHMFFDQERMFNFRKMILSESVEEREKALNKILPYQRDDFEKLFKAMNHYPVIIRYLDPPLHEFLPKNKDEVKELSESLNISEKELKNRIEELKEFNPMMGHRGVRLLVSYEEIARMQTRAVIEATINVSREGILLEPEIMIPLVNEPRELEYIKMIVDDTANKVMEEMGKKIKYKVGTMIETPRAALLSNEISKYAEFYSFGTNDLTQLTYGISRDDSKFLKDYYDSGIYKNDPFKIIDKDGVGKLIKLAIIKAKENKNIEIGICGEQAVQEESISFLREVGIDYISVSAYRVLEARLSSARVEILNKKSR